MSYSRKYRLLFSLLSRRNRSEWKSSTLVHDSRVLLILKMAPPPESPNQKYQTGWPRKVSTLTTWMDALPRESIPSLAVYSNRSPTPNG